MQKSFTLGRKTYSVSRATIEEKVKGALPKAIEKHYVEINGVRFPPKQVIALAAGVPLTSFTTTDATRLLAGFGFKVQQAQHHAERSDQLFRHCLAARGLSAAGSPPGLAGSIADADYSLSVAGVTILFEVKRLVLVSDNESTFDPYDPIRRLMTDARKRFGVPTGDCCSLVLVSEAPDVYSDWRFMYGAMLPTLVGGPPTTRHDDPLSAVLLLERLPVGQRRFQIVVRDRERQMGRTLTAEEYWREIEKSQGTERDLSLTQLRVVVHENPLARVRLPEIFRGPYDERYGASNGQLMRIWAGDEIARLDREAA
jgi:hypothetical protein